MLRRAFARPPQPQPHTYASAAAFAAATTGVTNVNFEGSPTGMGTYILGSGSYSFGGVKLTQDDEKCIPERSHGVFGLLLL